jgi:hypothetical protein
MNKNLLILILLVFCTTAIFAQSLTVDNVEINLSGEPIEAEFYDHTPMTNNSTESLDLRWVRTIESMPDEWDNYFCTIPGNCGLPSTDSLNFTLEPGEVGDFQIHFAPNDIAGSALVVVNLINNATDEVLATITINVETSPVSTNELEEAQVRVFPNPATNFFQIQNGQKVDQITIYNILGKQVKFFENAENQFFIGDLAKGLYMIQMVDLDSKSTKTLTLKKN